MDDSLGDRRRNIRGQTKQYLGPDDTADLVAKTLSQAYRGEKAALEQIAQDTGKSRRASENWLSGTNPMSLTAFLNAYQNNPRFKAWARKILLMEQDGNPQVEAAMSHLVNAIAQSGMPTGEEGP